MIFRFFKALWASLVAFVRPYDSEGGKNQRGMPLLSEWKHHDPYQAFFKSPGLKSKGQACAALIFESGRGKGEMIQLPAGRFRLGACLDQEIVVRETARDCESFSLEVSSEVVTAQAEKGDFKVNGHKLSFARLVDQDECEFNGVRFFFLEIQSTELESDDEILLKEAV
ncbi:MAG: hypothetical protein EA369_07425 [Bradymonadales bacterium]|nr:MAG: hypothetical protein EA369_07425 [Bradymonadales bacterium]